MGSGRILQRVFPQKLLRLGWVGHKDWKGQSRDRVRTQNEGNGLRYPAAIAPRSARSNKGQRALGTARGYSRLRSNNAREA